MSEHNEQTRVIQWWDITNPELSLCLTAYPSGAIIGGRNKFGLIAKLKREGWRKGVCDLFLAIPRGGKAGLWIEMKDINKTVSALSQEQKAHITLMQTMGYEAIWCAGADVAIAAITTYMNS